MFPFPSEFFLIKKIFKKKKKHKRPRGHLNWEDEEEESEDESSGSDEAPRKRLKKIFLIFKKFNF